MMHRLLFLATDRVTSTSTEPQWLKTLRANISRSVQHYGYQDAGPHIRRMVEELSLQAPPWLEELQTFVKSIVQFFGKDKVLQMLEPTIKVIQETYDVKIADVDIDQYGKLLFVTSSLNTILCTVQRCINPG
ncbi:jg21662 [Pararge aegeria aegeria]|uniref:Jg21662 protein n=1 Tax=Pararge aegeria aegeria TaxID=348720 RepID=A0A8S4RKZ7_9NEOP|nr:jg21662 [Pararge aegeria aegeria]